MQARTDGYGERVIKVAFKFDEGQTVYDVMGNKVVITGRRALLAGQSLIIDYLIDYGGGADGTAVWVYDTAISETPINVG